MQAGVWRKAPKAIPDSNSGEDKWRLAIPIALYRPQLGPLASNGKKGQKMDFGPTRKRRQNGQKKGKWPFLTHF